MHTIYKYPLQLVEVQDLQLPKGATILSVQNQNGVLCMWAQVDDGRDETGRRWVEERSIEIIGTGHKIWPAIERKFLGTVQMEGGSLVLHVFERLP